MSAMKEKNLVAEVTTSVKERGLNYAEATHSLRRRVHDRILVDDTLVRDYKDSDIQAINRCQLYLEVDYLHR
jgi:hypothetical protein